MQDAGTQACVKHYSKLDYSYPFPESSVEILLVGNEQELNRETVDADIDDRTAHEVCTFHSIYAGL